MPPQYVAKLARLPFPHTLPKLPTRGGGRPLSPCGRIGLFYRQVILHRGLPFTVRTFNTETQRVLRESEEGIGVAQFDSAEALFEDLGI